MHNPYSSLGERAFWRTGVLENHPLQLRNVYLKKFDISKTEWIATAGSCFAQHIAGRLRTAGYQVVDVEPAPESLDPATAYKFGFGLYSARYGNIYTVRQFLQLIQECTGSRNPIHLVWEKGDRFYDALRPSVEPRGLPSPEAVIRHRRQHLQHLRWMLDKISLLIFTMGLTEAWVQREDGTVYPTAPGTIAGSYDPSTYQFKNFGFTEILEDFIELRDILKAHSRNIRFILTVSPVPLTATAGCEHILAATMYSKSVLRAVAGQLAMTLDDVDYFPSYELISGIPSRSFFYESNLRSISPAGVDFVMKSFFEQHGGARAEIDNVVPEQAHLPRAADMAAVDAAQRVVCEEELLEAFSR